MPDLEFRSVRPQLTRERLHVIVFGVLFAASAAGFVVVPSGLLIFSMLLFAATTAQSGYWLWAYSRAYTRCTPTGIATRGLAGRREVPWPEVREITGTRRGSTFVTTASGRQVRLGAPVLNMSMAGAIDPEYAAKLRQLQAYWRRHARRVRT